MNYLLTTFSQASAQTIFTKNNPRDLIIDHARNGNTNSVKWLLTRVDDQQTLSLALQISVEKKHSDIVRAILSSNRELEPASLGIALIEASKHDTPDILRQILKSDRPINLFWVARALTKSAQNQKTEVTASILQQAVSIITSTKETDGMWSMCIETGKRPLQIIKNAASEHGYPLAYMIADRLLSLSQDADAPVLQEAIREALCFAGLAQRGIPEDTASVCYSHACDLELIRV